MLAGYLKIGKNGSQIISIEYGERLLALLMLFYSFSKMVVGLPIT